MASLLPGAPPVLIGGVSLDSRYVQSGDLYVALPGGATHGARFVDQAARAGAAAILTDPSGAELAQHSELPLVVVPDPRMAMAPLAAAVYGWPARELLMFGVTGTAGKTSTSFLVAAGLAAAGRQVGTIGTIGFSLGGERLTSSRTTVTTPEAPDLQALLGYLREHGADSVAMEAPPHAAALHRGDATTLDVGGFGDARRKLREALRFARAQYTRSSIDV